MSAKLSAVRFFWLTTMLSASCGGRVSSSSAVSGDNSIPDGSIATTGTTDGSTATTGTTDGSIATTGTTDGSTAGSEDTSTPTLDRPDGNGEASSDASGTLDGNDEASAQPSAGVDSGADATPATACTGGQKQCTGSTPQICDANGQWQSRALCAGSASSQCVDGSCYAKAPSCSSPGPGQATCGATSESCCASPLVTGGTFYRTYDLVYTDAGAQVLLSPERTADGGPTGLADPASVSAFVLNTYVVTVARFRNFVRAWNQGMWVPPVGSGRHTHLNRGLGLANSANPGTYETGWVANYNSNVMLTDANLAGENATWTPQPGPNESLPINYVNWYEAYAFCIWDGEFLPSATEWEYAAGGGNEHREHPWGITDPGTSSRYAIYNCYYPSGVSACDIGAKNIAPAGTATLGEGRWGQLDLAGEVAQWVLDGYGSPVTPCVDCAFLPADSMPLIMGNDFSTMDLPPPSRQWDYGIPIGRDRSTGFRCARSP